MPSEKTPRLGDPPPAVVELGPDALHRLDALYEGARARQRAELAASVEGTLRLVPRPLRPVIRKIAGVR